MIILKMWGGLGNQMFIYALYQSMISRGVDAKVDMSWFNQYDIHNGYELNKLFGIEVNVASQEEVDKYADVGKGAIHGLVRKTLKHNTQLLFVGHKATTYYPEVFNKDERYLQGYWQSELYFKEIESEIRKIFQFSIENKFKDKVFISLLEDVRKNLNAVSLHVRRGDYVSNNRKPVIRRMRRLFLGEQPALGDVCSLGYYNNAVDYLDEELDLPLYFIFTNDINWCKVNLRLPEGRYTFVDINTKENSYLDMYLMSQCNHNIIANSSFSWWGAWLNSHDDKIVIAPDRWFKDGYSGDIIPEDWITVSTI